MTTPPIDDIHLPKGAGRLPPWWMLLTPHETVDDWMILVEKKAQRKAKSSKNKAVCDIALTVNQDNDNDNDGDLYSTPSTDKSIRSLDLEDVNNASLQILETRTDASADGMHVNEDVDNTAVTRVEVATTPSHVDVEQRSEITSKVVAVTAVTVALGEDVDSLATDTDETRENAFNNELPWKELVDCSTEEKNDVMDTLIERNQVEALPVENNVEETLAISLIEEKLANKIPHREAQADESEPAETKVAEEMSVDIEPFVIVAKIEDPIKSEHLEACLVGGSSADTPSSDETEIREVAFGQLPQFSRTTTDEKTDEENKDNEVQYTSKTNSESERMLSSTEVEDILVDQVNVEVRSTLQQLTESSYFNEDIVKEDANIEGACMDITYEAATTKLSDNDVASQEQRNVSPPGTPYVIPDAGIQAEAFGSDTLRHVRMGKRSAPSCEHQTVFGQNLLSKSDQPSRCIVSQNVSLDDTSTIVEVNGVKSTKEEMSASDERIVNQAVADDTLHVDTKPVEETPSEDDHIIETPMKIEHIEATLVDGASSDSPPHDEIATGVVSFGQLPFLSSTTTEGVPYDENERLTEKSTDEPILLNECSPIAAGDSDDSLVKEHKYDAGSMSNQATDVEYTKEAVVNDEPNIIGACVDTICDATTIELTDDDVSAQEPRNESSSGTLYVMPDAGVDAEAFGPENLRHIEIGERSTPSWEQRVVAGQHLLKKAGQANKSATSPMNSSDNTSTPTDRRDHPLSPSEASGDAGAEARKADSGRVVAMAPKRRPRVFETAFTGVSTFDFAMQQRAQEKARREKERLYKEGLSRHHAQVVLVDTATELKKKQLEELRQKKEAEENLKKFKNDHGPSQFDTAGNLKKLDQEQKKAKKEAKELNHGFQASQSFVNRN